MDLSQLSETTITWAQVLLAVIAILGGWVAAHFVGKGVAVVLGRVPNLPAGVLTFATRFVRTLLILLGIGVALAFLGADVQPLIAIVLVVGVIVVLVLRGVADNFAASVLIQTRRPVTAGEEIMVEGPDGEPIVGTVVELNSRSVILRTVDGRTVHVPNAKLLADALVNHSRSGARRSEVQVRVELGGHAEVVDDVLARAVEAASSVDGIDGERVQTVVQSISPGRVIARLQFWHDPAVGLRATSDVIRAVHGAFAADGLAATVTSTPGLPPLVPPDGF
ncbi:mechanosensitive ion channel family protein [Agromyces sp. NPDC058110]|uniref:mechanosensitive ion channel family protein n=1 Tax=Agromyces sp. NPDC058110 TaxID=3346345 RepID=UPI0036DBDEFA